ncbi:MAG: hypothetical protein BGN95_01960 [Sphingomonas sp. 66-10]|uniref:FecR family protein n=1 Tax=Sphingomonas sp. 66-10 TaxID=1895848 RepID=UPI0009293BDF|nr:FecR domain-containing protein [Sphingomonas sp. 66-10]OJU19038.1 MAG: hypothetical protein BGN95_01960 [Sphingomonas sp. 66-10]
MTRESPAQIERDAARWAIRLGEDPDAQTLAELEEWLAGDRRRRGALLQMQGVSRLAETILSEKSGFDEATPARVPERTSHAITRRRALGIAAAAGLAVSGIWVLEERTRSYATIRGEVRSIPLADGSMAVMNTQSRINVTLAATSRTVRLDTGEAWFKVAHDRSKPFVVEAGPVRVRAVGTAFSVRRLDEGSRIEVSEGRVEIWSELQPKERITLSAGQGAFLADSGRIADAGTVDVDRRLAWREQRIDLEGETLAQAVAEFNRYNERQLVIVDPAVAGERFHGVFRAEDPESFAIAVHDSLRVPVSLSEPAEIRIGVPPHG